MNMWTIQVATIQSNNNIFVFRIILASEVWYNSKGRYFMPLYRQISFVEASNVYYAYFFF